MPVACRTAESALFYTYFEAQKATPGPELPILLWLQVLLLLPVPSACAALHPSSNHQHACRVDQGAPASLATCMSWGRSGCSQTCG